MPRCRSPSAAAARSGNQSHARWIQAPHGSHRLTSARATKTTSGWVGAGRAPRLTPLAAAAVAVCWVLSMSSYRDRRCENMVGTPASRSSRASAARSSLRAGHLGTPKLLEHWQPAARRQHASTLTHEHGDGILFPLQPDSSTSSHHHHRKDTRQCSWQQQWQQAVPSTS